MCPSNTKSSGQYDEGTKNVGYHGLCLLCVLFIVQVALGTTITALAAKGYHPMSTITALAGTNTGVVALVIVLQPFYQRRKENKNQRDEESVLPGWAEIDSLERHLGAQICSLKLHLSAQMESLERHLRRQFQRHPNGQNNNPREKYKNKADNILEHIEDFKQDLQHQFDIYQHDLGAQLHHLKKVLQVKIGTFEQGIRAQIHNSQYNLQEPIYNDQQELWVRIIPFKKRLQETISQVLQRQIHVLQDIRAQIDGIQPISDTQSINKIKQDVLDDIQKLLEGIKREVPAEDFKNLNSLLEEIDKLLRLQEEISKNLQSFRKIIDSIESKMDWGFLCGRNPL
ncbi:predicted protein [Aspergillus terreus NIH2624]|uniref:Uncharacterized protein n=1 Tax=Aspergillus terreus (strain NIH 2624 / FGSC A1156) TaxID=341663 RepID=Q0C7V2_ASPTN|nr:uncharacterized protein ATEG_10232 [Aspergillus terreus NIH2624]EAU29229.1 predicted protein [Aspergillus terreus NIH2624]